MNPSDKTPIPHPTDWEQDPVWKLLDQASPSPPTSRALTQKITATARMTPQARPTSRWHLLRHPAMLSVAAAIVMCAVPMVLLSPQNPSSTAGISALNPESDDSDIQEIAETEALIAAVDHLDSYSDSEIVELLGF